ncbi:MAG: DUF4270 family protein [Chitinophagaceae bacterium]
MKILKGKYAVALFIVLSVFTASCSNTQSDIGDTFFQSHSNILSIDTVTINMSTVYLDSIPTSGTGIALLGSYSDSIYGANTVSSYLQVGAPTVQSISSETSIYDSLCFMLKPNHYFVGDTTEDFNITVNQLTQLPGFGENESLLFNTSSFNYDPVPIGYWTGKIYPHLTDTVSVRLSDQLGNTLLSAIENNPDRLSTNNLFINNYLNGLMLSSQSPNIIYGFVASGDSSALMRLYYHSNINAKTELFTNFYLANNNLQFNHITTVAGNTSFAQLNGLNKIVSASQTNHHSVLQPLSNYAIRLSFPYLQNIEHLGRYVKIISAQLILRPEPGTYSFNRPLPPALPLCAVTNYYSVLDSISGPNGVEHGNPLFDYVYNNSSYSYDVTQYITNQLQATNDYNKNDLMLILPMPAYNATFQQFVLSNQLSTNPGIQLSIQAVVFNE